MLSVTITSLILSIIMLSVIMLKVIPVNCIILEIFCLLKRTSKPLSKLHQCYKIMIDLTSFNKIISLSVCYETRPCIKGKVCPQSLTIGHFNDIIISCFIVLAVQNYNNFIFITLNAERG